MGKAVTKIAIHFHELYKNTFFLATKDNPWRLKFTELARCPGISQYKHSVYATD
jgi:hypothetical protein